MSWAWRLAEALVDRLEPETLHRLSIRALAAGLGPRAAGADDPALAVTLWSRRFANPLGLAAGYDKNAEAVTALLGLGFGFVEVGTVTPEPQPGNPRPRLFRLAADRAAVNRMGFNNAGAGAMARRLAKLAAPPRPGPVGVNLGKNKASADAVADYARGTEILGPLADYVVVNVSSPNTPGLRALQDPAALAAIVAAVREALAGTAARAGPAVPPLLVKVAPDLAPEDLAAVAALAADTAAGIDGIVATNTTVDRPADLTDRQAAEPGGLSGRPLKGPATRVLAELYRLTDGAVPLVGVGGIETGADAYARIRAGASLVQLYTALAFDGPALVPAIKAELAALLRRDGFAGVAEAVGADHRAAAADAAPA